MVNAVDHVLFRETQKFRQKWLWLLLFSVILVVISQNILVVTYSNNSNEQTFSLVYIIAQAIGILVAIGFIYLFSIMELITEVRQDGLYLQFFPLVRRQKIEFSEIKSCGARKYNPILEYGGWGIRYSFFKGKAYNVSGNQGVQLEFFSQKPLLIGSQRANQLADAINAQIINLLGE